MFKYSIVIRTNGLLLISHVAPAVFSNSVPAVPAHEQLDENSQDESVSDLSITPSLETSQRMSNLEISSEAKTCADEAGTPTLHMLSQKVLLHLQDT